MLLFLAPFLRLLHGITRSLSSIMIHLTDTQHRQEVSDIDKKPPGDKKVPVASPDVLFYSSLSWFAVRHLYRNIRVGEAPTHRQEMKEMPPGFSTFKPSLLTQFPTSTIGPVTLSVFLA